MQQVKWFERKFDFSDTQNIFPSIIERLEGTALRLKHKMNTIPASILETRVNNTWSVKENIGHLSDLEPLWQLRLNEIINGKEILSPADLQNTKTENAGHNYNSIVKLLDDFSTLRTSTINMLLTIDESIIFKSAIHPRLQKPMRTMDLFLFVADHDDHHLATISAIANALKSSS